MRKNASHPVQPPTSSAARTLAAGGLVTALLASGALVTSELASARLPGCGAGSDCSRLSEGPWGTVPVIGLPISLVGFAYFAAAAAWWWAPGPRTAGRTDRVIVRLAAAWSLVLIAVMIAQRVWCPYCALSHAGNLLFAVAVEMTARRAATGAPAASRPRPLLRALATGVLVLLGLSGAWIFKTRADADASRQALTTSTDRIIAAPAHTTGFRGRYITGPGNARSRIVVFTDFQCPQCRALETELLDLVKARDDTSLSIKHFPLCSACNPAVPTSIHPRACDAAVAAEAAGAVGGPDAFWQAASWIFGRSGSFESSEFLDAAAGWGLNRAELERRLHDPATLELVKADVKEGLALEITRAPTVFINGVELQGWETPGAVRHAVEAIAAAPVAPSSASSEASAHVPVDAPADAQTRAIDQWLRASKVDIPARIAAAPALKDDVGVRVILFGDYQDAFSAEADAIIRAYVQTWPGTRYEFRHFPASSSCNPRLTINPHPLACRMARAAESARLLGGDLAFASVHEWLFEHRQDFSDAGLRQLATSLGIDGTVLVAAGRDARVQAALQADIDAGNALGISAIPAIYIDGRPLAVWKTQSAGEHITKVLDLAAQPQVQPVPSQPLQPLQPPPATAPPAEPQR